MKPIRSLSPNEDVQKLLVQLDANGDGNLEVKEIDHNQDGYVDAQLFPKGWDDQERISVEHTLFSHHLIQKIRNSSQAKKFYQDLLQDKKLNTPTNFLEDGNFNRIDHGKKRLDLFYKGDNLHDGGAT